MKIYETKQKGNASDAKVKVERNSKQAFRAR